MERYEAKKIKSWALAKYDERGRVIKLFLGMTPARFNRLKSG